LFLAVAIVLLGLCAALPFRQEKPINAPPRERPAPLALTLRRPDSPLELAPRIDVSPAEGLRREEPGVRRQEPGQPFAAVPDPTSLVPLPALPVSFQPSVSPQPNDWRPEAIVNMPRPKAQPRPYRLRDGDTLEKIAERLLGDRNRASEIFELNQGVLARPDLLPVGVTIMLPPRVNTEILEPIGVR
jgi:phage tail protein X